MSKALKHKPALALADLETLTGMTHLLDRLARQSQLPTIVGGRKQGIHPAASFFCKFLHNSPFLDRTGPLRMVVQQSLCKAQIYWSLPRVTLFKQVLVISQQYTRWEDVYASKLPHAKIQKSHWWQQVRVFMGWNFSRAHPAHCRQWSMVSKSLHWISRLPLCIWARAINLNSHTRIGRRQFYFHTDGPTPSLTVDEMHKLSAIFNPA